MGWRLALMLVLAGARQGLVAGAALGAALAPVAGLSLLGSSAAFVLVVLVVAAIVALIGMIVGLWLAFRVTYPAIGPMVRLRLAMRRVTIAGAILVLGVWLLRLLVQPVAAAP